jgi:hypothetical protein
MVTKTPRSGMSQKLVQVTLSNALDQSEKRLIEIGEDQTVRQAVIDAEMAPSGQFDVFSSVGEVVTNRAAAQVEGETLYIGPARIAGGSGNLTLDRIGELTLDFPTLLPVHDMVVNGKVEMFSLTIPDRKGCTKGGFYRLAIHCPDPGNQMPSAYVLNHSDVVMNNQYVMTGGSTGARYDHSTKTLPGTNQPAHWVCNGNYEPTYKAISNDIIARIAGFLNHIISVLNS